MTDDAAAKEVQGDKVEARVVKTSKKDIETSQKEAEDKLGDMVTSTAVDSSRNTVIITVLGKDGDAAKKAVEGLKNVEIETTDNVPSHETAPFADNKPGDNNIYGGEKINYQRGGQHWNCSVGFNVEKDGKDYFLTAGHCARSNPVFFQGGKRIGATQKFEYPGRDMAYASMEKGWTGKDAVKKWDGMAVIVKGAKEAPVCAAVCKSGQRTGWTCGTIKAKNTTAIYVDKETGKRNRIHGLTQASVCSDGGDSGGAWISGNQAQGVHSGSNGEKIIDNKAKTCRHKDGRPVVAYFQPIKSFLDTYGLKLKTRQ